MKKLVLITLIISLFAIPVFSQTTLEEFKSGFQTFADDIAAVLPMNSTIGLNWSDAYIGQFLSIPPNIGLGITTGFTTIPYKSIESVLSKAFNDSGSDVPGVVKDFGLPLPAIAIDARIGGFILPFDVGFKAGFIPKFAQNAIGDDVELDYLLIGGDIRYRVLKQLLIIPEVSVGLGYNYMKGNVAFGGILPGATTITVNGLPPPYDGFNGDTISLSSPDFYIDWETQVIDLKAQASWNLLILQPSIGIGASRGSSTVGGGAKSVVLYDDGGGAQPIADVPGAKEALAALGYDVDYTSIGVFSDVTGWSYRIFAGLSVNILILRIDAGVQYNLNGNNYGASIGGRIQL